MTETPLNSVQLIPECTLQQELIMTGYSNLAGIDIDDDMFAPEAYQRFQQHAAFTAPAMEERQHSQPVPLYEEHEYGAYEEKNEDPGDDWDEKLEYDAGMGQLQQRYRYATPELEGQQLPGQDTSFDGPEEYQSTENGNATPRRFERITRRNNINNSEKSINTLATDDEPLNPHFGPVPVQQLRRNRTRKRVALTSGHLIIDAPIPSRLSGFLPRKGQDEFDRMR